MRKPLIIGNNVFIFKKDALQYFKSILNKYDFFESLNPVDFEDVLALSNINSPYDFVKDEKDILKEKAFLKVIDIRIAKLKYNTKSFELIYSDLSNRTFSYIHRITKPKNLYLSAFLRACREAANQDLHRVKRAYFKKYSKKGWVKCQETGKLSKWEDLVIDHRQPNTFSIIVDRFIELNKIDLSKVDYISAGDAALRFKDDEIAIKFRKYHKSKAKLRIVRKECNSSRAYLAKTQDQNNDLKVK